jgi:hypothetical protein
MEKGWPYASLIGRASTCGTSAGHAAGPDLPFGRER